MRSEMDSMSENQVWTLVKPPEGIKPIGCKWVFMKKTDMDGNVQTYKGRLVTKAAFHDYEIWKMDVKTAFLNGKLEEDVCTTQPKGFVTPENATKEMCPSMPQERERMIQIPYASAIGSIMQILVKVTGQQLKKHPKVLEKELRMYFFSMEAKKSLKSSKQDTIADSTTKAEYVSASEATKETVWIKEFIYELRVIISIADAASTQAKEPRSHHRPKHTFKCFYLI
ncbi:hypothetical protein V6N11_002203 [Hibiscus sabdariffa]|uniref:Reverse transcriptase Ty1/copia-type domain-containing protein n=1 Tax=Hibiscus sabdariffa TaxID=183260 RepID=A0ABR2QVC0_9ROSI